MQIVSTPPPPGQSIVRRRIAKNGNQSIGSGAQSVKITSWVSDSTYPGTVSSDGLYIPSAGSGVATASINAGGDLVAGTCTLRKNATTASDGTQLGTVSIPTAWGVRTITTGTISLAVGDILTVWYTVSNGNGKTVTAASTFIDWNPSS